MQQFILHIRYLSPFVSRWRVPDNGDRTQMQMTWQTEVKFRVAYRVVRKRQGSKPGRQSKQQTSPKGQAGHPKSNNQAEGQMGGSGRNKYGCGVRFMFWFESKGMRYMATLTVWQGMNETGPVFGLRE